MSVNTVHKGDDDDDNDDNNNNNNNNIAIAIQYSLGTKFVSEI